MKARFYFSFILVTFFSNTFSQNVENPGFDSVYIGGIDRIHAWISSDAWFPNANDTVNPLTPNTHYVSIGLQHHELLQTAQLEYSNAFEGSYAIKVLSITGTVKSNGAPYKGFVTNGNHFYTDSLGYIDFKKGGTPFAYKPSKLRGHFKFDNTSPSLTNFGKASVLLKKYNTFLHQIDTIAFGGGSFQFFPTANWTPFELPLNYISSQTPDSIVLAFESSATGLSSTFWIDSLGFFYPSPSAVVAPAKVKIPPFYHDAANHIILLNSEANIQEVTIVDNAGKIVRRRTNESNSINLAGLSNGIYFLEVVSINSKKEVFKIFCNDFFSK